MMLDLPCLILIHYNMEPYLDERIRRFAGE